MLAGSGMREPSAFCMVETSLHPLRAFWETKQTDLVKINLQQQNQTLPSVYMHKII